MKVRDLKPLQETKFSLSIRFMKFKKLGAKPKELSLLCLLCIKFGPNRSFLGYSTEQNLLTWVDLNALGEIGSGELKKILHSYVYD